MRRFDVELVLLRPRYSLNRSTAHVPAKLGEKAVFGGRKRFIKYLGINKRSCFYVLSTGFSKRGEEGPFILTCGRRKNKVQLFILRFIINKNLPPRTVHPMIRRSDNLIALDRLPVGKYALVREVDGPPDDVHRLEEFGVRRGMRIEMFRPGDPCILRLSGNKICLRADDRLRIWVEQDV